MSADTEVNEALERLDRALESPRILAAKAVAEFRGGESSQPWVNVRDSGAPLLNRDAVIRASEPNHAPVHGPSVRAVKIPWRVKLCWWR